MRIILQKSIPIIALALLILPVFAVMSAEIGGEFKSLDNPLGTTSISCLVKKIAEIIFKIGFLVAAIMLILSGMKFVTARGNPEELTKAKKMFLWTVIGAAVLLGAVVIVEAIIATLKSFGATNIDLGSC